jgi:hypothetical protein
LYKCLLEYNNIAFLTHATLTPVNSILVRLQLSCGKYQLWTGLLAEALSVATEGSRNIHPFLDFIADRGGSKRSSTVTSKALISSKECSDAAS